MKSIKEVYDNLKKYDVKKQLFISNDNNSMEFKLNDNEKIIMWEDYLSIELKGKSITHWHPDYDEMYYYILKIVNGEESFPRKKEIGKSRLKINIIVIILAIFVNIAYIIIDEKYTYLKIIIVILFIMFIYYIKKNIQNRNLNNIQKLMFVPPNECEEPKIGKKEVERIYNYDKSKIIIVHNIDNFYKYEILVKNYDDYNNEFYWCPLHDDHISYFDTKEKAIEEAMILYSFDNKSFERKESVVAAYHFCSNNKLELIGDNLCGCFHCLKIFNPNKIVSWIEEQNGTAICPFCGIDSIIGESSKYPITKEFLEEMKKYWF